MTHVPYWMLPGILHAEFAKGHSLGSTLRGDHEALYMRTMMLAAMNELTTAKMAIAVHMLRRWTSGVTLCGPRAEGDVWDTDGSDGWSCNSTATSLTLRAP